MSLAIYNPKIPSLDSAVAIHYHLQVQANSKKIVQKKRCYF